MEREEARFASQVAVVTGAAGRIGSALSKRLTSLGCSLVLVDANQQGLSDLNSELGESIAVACDLERPEDAVGLIGEAVKRLGSCDILVNNAAFVGTSSLEGWATPFEDQSVATFSRALQVNLTAAFALSQALAPALKASGGGRIVNIGSIYGVCAPDFRIYDGTTLGNPAAYACSKAGLIQLTRWLATALAPSVRVNSVSPGGIEAGQSETFVKRYESRTPLGRMARVEDVVGAILFLADPKTEYITGQNLMVDGGWSAW